MNDIKKAMFKKEIANMIGISEKTLTNWINKNEMLKKRVGRRGLIPASLVRLIFREFDITEEGL